MIVDLRPLLVAVLAVPLVGLVGGCGESRPPATPSTPPSPVAAPPAPTSDPDLALCRAYNSAAASARTPLDAMRTEAVLVPFVDYIELGSHEIAARAGAARTPEVAGALRELAAAQEDLDAQGRANLPPGADLAKATVRVNPGRLAAALDATDKACAAAR